MTLAWLVIVPLAGGVAAWGAERLGPAGPRAVALLALALDGLLLAPLLAAGAAADLLEPGAWIAALRWPWIPRFGIELHLRADGIGVLMAALTVVLGIAAVLASWSEIRERAGFFHFNLLWTIAGALGVFLALDLFAFFFFWEVMLVPMVFVIALWGHAGRIRAAVKFFLFTHASSLLMLAAILALVLLHERATGTLTFDALALGETARSPRAATWIMLGFFAAFAVKLPAVPVHTWLPDAHTEAPTAGSVILAGVLLKTGAYGLLRFAIPLFPEAAAAFAPTAMALGVAGILYGAVLAFAQHDFKRLVAYSSVSHLGFVLLGAYAGTAIARQGAVVQMIAHGLSSGALFVLAGALQARLGTRDMRRMGGLWGRLPRLGAATAFFAIASLGLPGLGNFVGEFLVLVGTFAAAPVFAVLAALGLVTAVVYALGLVQRPFHGPEGPAAAALAARADLGRRELALTGALAALLLGLGLYPQPVLDVAAPALREIPALAPGAGLAAGGGGGP